MYILANSTCPLKTYVRLHNLISMKFSHSFFGLFLYNCKEKAEKNRLLKAFENPDFFNSNFNEHFVHNKGL